jgi:hypothetical protein
MGAPRIADSVITADATPHQLRFSCGWNARSSAG